MPEVPAFVTNYLIERGAKKRELDAATTASAEAAVTLTVATDEYALACSRFDEALKEWESTLEGEPDVEEETPPTPGEGGSEEGDRPNEEGGSQDGGTGQDILAPTVPIGRPYP